MRWRKTTKYVIKYLGISPHSSKASPGPQKETVDILGPSPSPHPPLDPLACRYYIWLEMFFLKQSDEHALIFWIEEDGGGGGGERRYFIL